jgi:hypothetical protein
MTITLTIDHTETSLYTKDTERNLPRETVSSVCLRDLRVRAFSICMHP